MITEIDLLSESECEELHSIVHDLKPFWIHRHPFFPFYTLAIASYIDAVGEHLQKTYSTRALTYNPILNENFGWLYRKVMEVLANILEAPVSYNERFALPGFHIFLSHETFKHAKASVHRDLQYRLLDLEHPEEMDTSMPISFTLSIRLPKSGTGLWIWNLHHEEIDRMSPAEVDRLIDSRKKTFYAYKTGRLVLHSGHDVHQIASMPELQPGDERITLQGHGILLKGVWQLYW